MKKGGRDRHYYWEEGVFEPRIKKVICNEGKTNQYEKLAQVAFCPKCKKCLSNTGERRMRSHRKSCKLDSNEDIANKGLVTALSKRKNRSSSDGDTETNQSDFSENNVAPDDLFVPIPKPTLPVKNISHTLTIKPSAKKRNANVSAFLDSIDEKSIARANQELLSALIETGCPFELSSSKHFSKFCQILRPAFTPASSKKLVDDYLPLLYSNVKDNFSENSNGILLITQTADSSYISMTLTRENKCLYIDSSHSTLDTLEQFISLSSKKLQTSYGCQAYAVVSNAEGKKMPVIKDDRSYWYLQCMSSTIKQLLDLIFYPKIRHELDKILVEFNEYVKKDEILRQGGKKMVLSVDTQLDFEDFFDQVKPVFDNLPIMRKIVSENNFTFEDKDVIVLLIQNELERNLKKVMDAINYLQKMLQLQQNSCSIAQLVDNFIKLYVLCEDLECSVLVKNCIGNELHTIHLVAHVLHPVYQGVELDILVPDWHKKVQEFFIKEFNEAEMESWIMYREKQGLIGNLLKKNYSSPYTFYKVIESEHRGFAQFSMKIVNLPAFTTHKNLSFNLQKNLSLEQEKMVTELFYLLKCNDD